MCSRVSTATPCQILPWPAHRSHDAHPLANAYLDVDFDNTGGSATNLACMAAVKGACEKLVARLSGGNVIKRNIMQHMRTAYVLDDW